MRPDEALVLLALLLLGCSKKNLTIAECERLSDQMTEVSKLSAAEKASLRQTKNADPGHAGLMKECARDTSRSQFECMMAAKSTVEIGRCK